MKSFFERAGSYIQQLYYQRIKFRTAEITGKQTDKTFPAIVVFLSSQMADCTLRGIFISYAPIYSIKNVDASQIPNFSYFKTMINPRLSFKEM